MDVCESLGQAKSNTGKTSSRALISHHASSYKGFDAGFDAGRPASPELPKEAKVKKKEVNRYIE